MFGHRVAAALAAKGDAVAQAKLVRHKLSQALRAARQAATMAQRYPRPVPRRHHDAVRVIDPRRSVYLPPRGFIAYSLLGQVWRG